MKKTIFILIGGACLFLQSLQLYANKWYLHDTIPEKSGARKNKLDVKAGVALVSQFIWRGITIDNAPAIQPYATLGLSGFELGIYGSEGFIADQPFKNTKIPYSEIDLVAKYTYSFSKNGSAAIYVTDYFLPCLGKSVFNYNNFDAVPSDTPDHGPGAHWASTSIEYNGPQNFPLQVIADCFFYNAYEKPLYLEVGYSVAVGSNRIAPFLGCAKGLASDKTATFYENNKTRVGLVNVGFAINREINITEHFSLPVNVQFAFNPSAEKAYFVFKVSL